MAMPARLMAALYDPMLAGAEKAGLAERRAGLLAEARGRTLEIGAGTGLNLAHYPEAVTELILTEPEEAMADRLRARVAAGVERPTRVLVAPAERLPVEDAGCDTVVATLVLCTVGDPAAALSEVHRVLRPGGRLLFLEHVRSRHPSLARWQDRVVPVWRWLNRGCHPNRDTPALLEASPLRVERLEHERTPKAPPIVRPAVRGIAVRPA